MPWECPRTFRLQVYATNRVDWPSVIMSGICMYISAPNKQKQPAHVPGPEVFQLPLLLQLRGLYHVAGRQSNHITNPSSIVVRVYNANEKYIPKWLRQQDREEATWLISPPIPKTRNKRSWDGVSRTEGIKPTMQQWPREPSRAIPKNEK